MRCRRPVEPPRFQAPPPDDRRPRRHFPPLPHHFPALPRSACLIPWGQRCRLSHRVIMSPTLSSYMSARVAISARPQPSIPLALPCPCLGKVRLRPRVCATRLPPSDVARWYEPHCLLPVGVVHVYHPHLCVGPTGRSCRLIACAGFVAAGSEPLPLRLRRFQPVLHCNSRPRSVPSPCSFM